MHEIVQHDHAQELIALAGPCLELRESENNLPLGLAHTLARDPRYFGDDPPLLLSILKYGNPVGMEDLPLMSEWIVGFAREALGEKSDPGKAMDKAVKYIGERNLYVWDHEGPVSIARESRPMKHGTVISLVYTPPERRGRGYATSCVYRLTKNLLAGRYQFCSLFTDLANPTSNHIYPRVGYVPLGDTLEFNFEHAAGHAER